MATLHLLGNTLAVTPLDHVQSGAIILPEKYREDHMLWKVLNVGSGRLTKKGVLIPIEVAVGDTVLTAPHPETLHDWPDGVRVIDARSVLAVL